MNSRPQSIQVVSSREDRHFKRLREALGRIVKTAAGAVERASQCDRPTIAASGWGAVPPKETPMRKHWHERLEPGRAASHVTVQTRWEPRAGRARMRCRSRRRKILLPLVEGRVSNAPWAKDRRNAHTAAVGRGTRRLEGRHRGSVGRRRFLVRLHGHPASFALNLSFGRGRVDDVDHKTA